MNDPAFDQPYPAPTTEQERSWGMLAHASLLTWFLTAGLGFLLGPLIVWLVKKDESPFVDVCGKEALNFGINAVGWVIVTIVCALTIILIPVAFILGIASGVMMLVMPIVALLKAKDGVPYRYPFIFRIL
jgi:uncharacterized Tic20 family protein